MLRGPSQRVTLIGAVTAGRVEIACGVVHDPGEQRFPVDHVLAGPHQVNTDTVFTMARIRIEHLGSSAQLPGISMELAQDWSKLTARYGKTEQGPAFRWI
ncbi:hypothetical protein GCM10022226_53660 [Sphaerisporangium flaviroseum]|uniref:Uncharacterized protein n=1 Tax=Sphaerisporangium flaviroseum TaxID=509199 RepID=A0ABP7ISX1_9ACTN